MCDASCMAQLHKSSLRRPNPMHANRTNVQEDCKMQMPLPTPRSLAHSYENADEYEYNAFMANWLAVSLLLNDDASMS